MSAQLSFQETRVIQGFWVPLGELSTHRFLGAGDLFTQDLERPEGIGGCQFLRLMKSQPKLRQIPVLIISGHPLPWARQLMKHDGIDMDQAVDGYLAKPFSAEQLSASIEIIFARRRLAPQFAAECRDEAPGSQNKTTWTLNQASRQNRCHAAQQQHRLAESKPIVQTSH